MTDEERLADIEDNANCAERMQERDHPVEDVRWLIGRVRALTAERDALLVERDAWKIRVTG